MTGEFDIHVTEDTTYDTAWIQNNFNYQPGPNCVLTERKKKQKNAHRWVGSQPSLLSCGSMNKANVVWDISRRNS